MNREQRRMFMKDIQKRIDIKSIQSTFKKNDLELNRDMKVSEGIYTYDLSWLIISNYIIGKPFSELEDLIGTLTQWSIPKLSKVTSTYFNTDFLTDDSSQQILISQLHHIISLDNSVHSGIEFISESKPETNLQPDFAITKLATFLSSLNINMYSNILKSGNNKAIAELDEVCDGLAVMSNEILCACKIRKQFGFGFFGETPNSKDTTLIDIVQTILAWWVLRNPKARKVVNFKECQESLIQTLETQFPSEHGKRCIELVLNLIKARDNLKKKDIDTLKDVFDYLLDTQDVGIVTSNLFLHASLGETLIVKEYAQYLNRNMYLVNENEELKEEYKQLEEQSTTSSKDTFKLVAEKEQLKEEVKKAKEKIKLLHQTVSELSGGTKEHEEIKQLKSEKQTLIKSQKSKVKEIQKLTSRTESLEQKLAEKEKENAELQRQLRELKAKNTMDKMAPQEIIETPTTDTLSDIIEYLKPFKIVVVGGITGYKNRLQKILPNCKVYPYEDVGRVPQIKGADLVCVYTRAVHHPDRWAVDNHVAVSGQPYCQIKNSNLEMSLRDMYNTLKTALEE